MGFGTPAILSDRRHRRYRLLTLPRQRLSFNQQRVARALENDVRVAATRVASIESALGGLKNRNTQDRAASVQLAELERVALANRTLYEQLLQRFNETRDQQDIVQADARVVAMAAPPAVPSSPGPKLFAAAGLAFPCS